MEDGTGGGKSLSKGVEVIKEQSAAGESLAVGIAGALYVSRGDQRWIQKGGIGSNHRGFGALSGQHSTLVQAGMVTQPLLQLGDLCDILAMRWMQKSAGVLL